MTNDWPYKHVSLNNDLLHIQMPYAGLTYQWNVYAYVCTYRPGKNALFEAGLPCPLCFLAHTCSETKFTPGRIFQSKTVQGFSYK
jgi:hypothetical protein